MAIIKSVRGFDPKFGDNCYLADNATIIGDVTMGDDCSIWFGAVVIHTLYQKSKTKIGDNVSVGHNAVIHGATIEDNCLIGMGAVVLDNAVVGHGSVVAAGSVVLTGTVIEPGSIYAGVPAKKVKSVDPEQNKTLIEGISNGYVMYASWYKE